MWLPEQRRRKVADPACELDESDIEWPNPAGDDPAHPPWTDLGGNGPILGTVNGRRPEQSDFLKDAARTETWRELRVGVLHSRCRHSPRYSGSAASSCRE
ncbi:MAG: hypothetical protein OXH04_04655 [Acidobacteria bacterium]|nr:hypothetical protein [Acidobacteriota bacterium]